MPVGPLPLILVVASGLIAALAIGLVIAIKTRRTSFGFGIGGALGIGWIAALFIFGLFIGVEGTLTYRATLFAAEGPALRDSANQPVSIPTGQVAFIYLDHPGCFELVDAAAFHDNLPARGKLVKLEMGVTRDLGRVRGHALQSINGVRVNSAWRGGSTPTESRENP